MSLSSSAEPAIRASSVTLPKESVTQASAVLEEFRRGWKLLVVGAVGLPICIMPGATIGVFIQPLAETFGWSLISISGVMAFSGCGTIIGAPIIGRLIDRLGFRKVVLTFIPILSAVIAATSLIGASVWCLYAMMFLWGLAGAGWVASFVRSISCWFVNSRGAAIGILFTAGGVGCALAPYFTQWAIDRHGWPMGFVSLAAAVLIAWPIAFLWLYEKQDEGDPETRRPSIRDRGHTRNQALRSALFWHLSAAWLLSGLTAGGFFFLVPSLLKDGLSHSEAAGYLSVFYAASAVVHIPLGAINDRISPVVVSAVALALKAVAFCLLGLFGSRYAFVAAVCAGFGVSGLSNSLFNCLPRFFGLRTFGEIAGLISSISSAASMLGPLLFGLVLSFSNSYRAPYLMIAALSLSAAVCLIVAVYLDATVSHSTLDPHEESAC